MMWNENFDSPPSPWFRDQTDDGTTTSIRLASPVAIRRGTPPQFNTARSYLEYLWIKDGLGRLEVGSVPLVRMPDTFHVQVPRSIRDKYLGSGLLRRFKEDCGYYRNEWQLRVLEEATRAPEWDPVGEKRVDHYEGFPPDVAWLLRALAIQRGASVKSLFMGAVLVEHERWLSER